jgi:hypothetical protein
MTDVPIQDTLDRLPNRVTQILQILQDLPAQ